MVGEFPELQGTMGRVYALHDGVSRDVAGAIFEHYLPRGAEDRLPEGDLGALLGLADRLDLLVGLFGLGKERNAVLIQDSHMSRLWERVVRFDPAWIQLWGDELSLSSPDVNAIESASRLWDGAVSSLHRRRKTI